MASVAQVAERCAGHAGASKCGRGVGFCSPGGGGVKGPAASSPQVVHSGRFWNEKKAHRPGTLLVSVDGSPSASRPPGDQAEPQLRKVP